MCTPRMRPAVPSGRRSATTFTRPSVSPMIRARLLPAEGVLLDRHDVDAPRARPGPRSGRRTPPRDGSRWPRAHGRSRPAPPARRGCALIDHDRLGEADVGQLRRAGHHVAHRPHVLLVGLLVLVGDHEAPVVQDAPPCPPTSSPSVRGRRPTDTTTDGDLDLAAVAQRARPSPCRPPGGVCPCTCTPVEDLDPSLAERPGHHRRDLRRRIRRRMESSASSTVTLDPRSESSEANSQPMAPPPTTATDGGQLDRGRGTRRR